MPKTDPCASNGCVVPPAEFGRLRYFYGQRLGVVELTDEQSYLIGKQRFHNLRAHGVGVLCGLRAERYVFPQGLAATTLTTLLRVRRGAALDWCGREIVVGWDQCIDVAAWLAQHPKARPAEDGNALRLWVTLCYRECPSDPSPAPRDPCGCDAGGCEFARIREGFELKLLTDVDLTAAAAAHQAAADLADVEEALGISLEAAFARQVALLVAADCPQPPDDACLLLANFEAIFDSNRKVVDIKAPDNTIPQRRSLLRTEVLQQGLLAALASAGNAELIGSGPRLSTATFINAGPDSGTLSVAIDPSGADLSRDPTKSPAQLTVSVSQLTVSVSQFKDDGTWAAVPTSSPTYVAGPPASLELTCPRGLQDGGRYRVLIESDRKQPTVDQNMRPLTPPSWARHFRLVKDSSSGNLTLAASVY
jgi:hypothetical protein